MMYNSKLAMAVKVNGKVLREFNKDTVYVPFGSEYTILLKNLNTRRVLINIFIDGSNVTDSGLVLYAGQEVDLERSIKNGNLSKGNRFKFIERTSQIEDHRGVKLEDGLIRVEYQFEREVVKHVYVPYPNSPIWIDPLYPYSGYPRITYTSGSLADSAALGMTTSSINAVGQNSVQAFNSSTHHPSPSSKATRSLSQNDSGITVAGSESSQKFSTASHFWVEDEKHSMVIKLLGATEENLEVTKPVTVDTKVKCTTCGRQNKANAKFCSNCGTSLQIF